MLVDGAVRRGGACASCLLRPHPRNSSSAPSYWILQRRWKGYIAPPGEQARPITGFYAEMLKKRPSSTAPESKPNPAPTPAPTPPPKDTPPKSQKELTLERARTVFGSKPGARERRIEIDAASRSVAGIRVPPKPTEPDNCCMSGCVNCVWDMYRDEMEEWAEKSKEARAALAKAREGEDKGDVDGQISMDDDGGVSETNWVGRADDGDGDKMFDDIPVGIREFMKTEKKLKQRHREEGEGEGARA